MSAKITTISSGSSVLLTGHEQQSELPCATTISLSHTTMPPPSMCSAVMPYRAVQRQPCLEQHQLQPLRQQQQFPPDPHFLLSPPLSGNTRLYLNMHHQHQLFPFRASGHGPPPHPPAPHPQLTEPMRQFLRQQSKLLPIHGSASSFGNGRPLSMASMLSEQKIFESDNSATSSTSAACAAMLAAASRAAAAALPPPAVLSSSGGTKQHHATSSLLQRRFYTHQGFNGSLVPSNRNCEDNSFLQHQAVEMNNNYLCDLVCCVPHDGKPKNFLFLKLKPTFSEKRMILVSFL